MSLLSFSYEFSLTSLGKIFLKSNFWRASQTFRKLFNTVSLQDSDRPPMTKVGLLKSIMVLAINLSA